MACDPNTLITGAEPFKRVPPGMSEAIITYLLAVWAGGSLDPNTLMQQAREFQGKIPPGLNDALHTYLLAQIAGASSDPSTLMQQAKSMQQLRGFETEVILNLLCQIAQP